MKEQVLVVDDDGMIRKILEVALLRYNFAVTAAEDGKRALLHLQENTFDMVITDVQMHTVDGFDVARRARERSPRTIVFIMSGCDHFQFEEMAVRAKAEAFLLKPFSLEHLHALVERHLFSHDLQPDAGRRCDEKEQAIPAHANR